MHPDTMRLIDRWAGIPLCFVTGLWSWIKSALKIKSDNDTKKDPIITAEPLPDVTIPSDDEIVTELAETYTLKKEQIT